MQEPPAVLAGASAHARGAGGESGDDPIPRTSVVNHDSVESVSLGTLVERLGRLSDDRMRQVCAVLTIAVAREA